MAERRGKKKQQLRAEWGSECINQRDALADCDSAGYGPAAETLWDCKCVTHRELTCSRDSSQCRPGTNSDSVPSDISTAA